MSAFLGISVWVTLATVVPGLVTMAVLYWSLVVVNVAWIDALRGPLEEASDWIWAGLGISIMVLTQSFGILLEGLLIRRRWLGPVERTIKIEPGIDPHGQTLVRLRPYDEYQGLYILLAELREDEDTQGHLKRALAQFFLTNNTLVSFIAAMILTVVTLGVWPSQPALLRSVIWLAILVLLLLVSFRVARIRFEVMGKALWAARRRRLRERGFREHARQGESGTES